MPDFNVTVSAVFNPKPTHTITLGQVTNGIISSDPQESAYEGQTVTLTASANPGYEFVAWNVTGATVADATSATTTFEMGTQDVTVSAEFVVSTNVVDELTGSAVAEAMNAKAYKDWELTTTNGTTYVGNTNESQNYIQMNSGTPRGIVSTESIGIVKKVEVTFVNNTSSGRTITVYGKNQPYESGADLYSAETKGTELGTIVQGNNTQIIVSGNYSYIGLLANGALYVEPIKITWEPNGAVSTTTTINVPTNFNTDIHQGTNAGTLTATVTAEGNTISGATVTWSSSNTGVATIDANGAVTLVAVGTTTITASYAGVEDEYRPSEGTYELTVTDSNAPGTENNPYTVAQARAAIDAGTGTQGVYATGIVCTASNNLYSGKYLSYYISDDGSETDRLEAYNGLGLNGANFTSVNDVQVGATVVIYGNLTKYNQTYEFAADNYLVSYTAPVITDPFITVTPSTITATEEGGNGTLSVTYENITEIEAEVYFCNAQGLTATYDWISASINSENNVAYTISANDGAARTAYLKVKVGETYSNLVTITQAAYMAPFEGGSYTLATSIESGKTYIIVGLDGDDVYAMGVQNQNNRGAVAISIDGTTASVNAGIAAYEFVIESAGDNVYSIHDARTPGYLYAASSESNYLKTESNLDDNGKWTISIDVEDGEATIIAQGSNTRKLMRFNPNTSNNNPLFACYKVDNTTGSLPRLYVKVPSLNITGYGATTNTGGYYLIASPVSTTPEDAGMITTNSNYDLYYFDDTQEKEWINYKNEDGSVNENFGDLVPGKGYLYANSADVTLTFTGTPYDGNGEFTVPAGWHLLGNPFAETAYIGREFYTMNGDGSALIASTNVNDPIDAMHGVFVKATAEETVAFSTTAPGKNSESVVLNVMKNRGNVIDRAIVRFGEGQQLPKFQLNPNSTKIYVTEGNEDFAVVRSANEGEMPVSFKASENGTYTLAVETENVEMDYLHLIDNMTGMDVDLLQTPSYTFEASTRDYANRFRLVFKGNSANEQTTETFAYFNGTSWTVSNLGEATLQVVDVMGRLVSTEQINGNATLNLNETPGIYMLRLVNGNDVKVQKVVVR